jgi:hypothetical protein
MLRGVRLSASAAFVSAIGLSIPAYLLYVPVCSFAAMLGTPALGAAEDYMPSPLAVIVGSVFGFVSILLVFALVLRLCVRIPTAPDETPLTTDRPQTTALDDFRQSPSGD